MNLKLIVEDKGDRIDRWLSKHILNISRARIQKLIQAGNIILNNKICKTKKEQLIAGDCLEVFVPSPKKLELIPEAIPLDVLYEDKSNYTISYARKFGWQFFINLQNSYKNKKT